MLNENDVIEGLWEEYKLRQSHYWSSFDRFGLMIITI
jgi:hypothetical protein